MSLNISDFSLFFLWKLQPSLKKVTPLFQQHPSKSWCPVKSPLFENLVGGSPPPPPSLLQKEGGRSAHYAIVLVLFHGEHFYGFSENDSRKCQKKRKKEKHIHFTTNISIYTGNRYFWFMIFMIYDFYDKFFFFFCTYCKDHYAYILLYMLKTLLKLTNQKEQCQIKFYKRSLGELIFSWATENLKMFHFTHSTGQMLKK